MQPEFARAVDPIFLETIKISESIERNEPIVAADLRARLTRKLEDAQHLLGETEDWKLAKYALCAWIDSLLIHAPWDGRAWWKDNCFEEKYFSTRNAHEDFFRKASDASTLSSKNALEVFYLAVVMGFRGLYDDSDAGYKSSRIKEYRLPNSIEGWCQTTARSLQLRQGRPDIPEQTQVAGTARPLRGKSMLSQFAMIGMALFSLAIGAAIFVLMNR